MRAASCDTLVPADFTRFLSPDHCVPPFSIIYEDKRSFGSSWDDPIDDSNTSRPDDDPISLAWTYRSALELQETLFWGQRGFYPGGGYTLDLPKHPFVSSHNNKCNPVHLHVVFVLYVLCVPLCHWSFLCGRHSVFYVWFTCYFVHY